jgi:hypothetical protein
MKPLRKFLVLFPGVLLAGAIAYGQNAGENTAGPTANDYELKVLEPAQGASITGSSVRVYVDTALPRSLGGFTPRTDRMPRPFIHVFLDGQPKADLYGGHELDTIKGVTPGDHTLVFEALNRSGEVIDRRAVRFREVAENARTRTPAADSARSGVGE